METNYMNWLELMHLVNFLELNEDISAKLFNHMNERLMAIKKACVDADEKEAQPHER